MIKRLLVAALAFALYVPVAEARIDTRQNSDGTADHIGARTDFRFGNCVGGANLQFAHQLNAAITTYAVSPVTNAVVRSMQAVVPDTHTGVTHLKVFVNQLTTPVRFFSNSTSLVSHATLQFAAAAAGTVARISTANEVSGAAGLTSNTVKEGDYIAVSTDQGGTNLITASVIVQVCPR